MNPSRLGNIIYDTLFQNTKWEQFDLSKVEDQCVTGEGTIYMTIDGTTFRISMEVVDADSETEEFAR